MERIYQVFFEFNRKCTGSVSGKTSILITGSILEDNRPVTESKKYKDAVEKKVKVMTESEFDDYLFKSNQLNIE